MEEQIKRIMKRFNLIGELASFNSKEGYNYIFDNEVSVFYYSDNKCEVKFDEVAVDRGYISFPTEMTAKGLESICINLELLMEKYITPQMQEKLTAFKTLKCEREEIDAKIKAMRKGNDET
jgi:hypothetical protein